MFDSPETELLLLVIILESLPGKTKQKLIYESDDNGVTLSEGQAENPAFFVSSRSSEV